MTRGKQWTAEKLGLTLEEVPSKRGGTVRRWTRKPSALPPSAPRKPNPVVPPTPSALAKRNEMGELLDERVSSGQRKRLLKNAGLRHGNTIPDYLSDDECVAVEVANLAYLDAHATVGEKIEAVWVAAQLLHVNPHYNPDRETDFSVAQTRYEKIRAGIPELADVENALTGLYDGDSNAARRKTKPLKEAFLVDTLEKMWVAVEGGIGPDYYTSLTEYE